MGLLCEVIFTEEERKILVCEEFENDVHEVLRKVWNSVKRSAKVAEAKALAEAAEATAAPAKAKVAEDEEESGTDSEMDTEAAAHQSDARDVHADASEPLPSLLSRVVALLERRLPGRAHAELQAHLRSRATAGGPPALVLALDTAGATPEDLAALDEAKLWACTALESCFKSRFSRETADDILWSCAVAYALGVGDGPSGERLEGLVVRYSKAAISHNTVHLTRELLPPADDPSPPSSTGDVFVRHFDVIEALLRAVALRAPRGPDALRVVRAVAAHAASETSALLAVASRRLEGLAAATFARNDAERPGAADADAALDEASVVLQQCRLYAQFVADAVAELDKRCCPPTPPAALAAVAAVAAPADDDGVATVRLEDLLGPGEEAQQRSPSLVAREARPQGLEPSELFPTGFLSPAACDEQPDEPPLTAREPLGAAEQEEVSLLQGPAAHADVSLEPSTLFPSAFLQFPSPSVQSPPVSQQQQQRESTGPLRSAEDEREDARAAEKEFECALQVVTGHYVGIEEYYMSAGFSKAVAPASADQQDAQCLVYQPIADDAFYVLTRSVERAAGTADINAFCATIGSANTKIEAELLEAFRSSLDAWSKSERRVDVFISIINDIGAAMEDTGMLREHAKTQLAKNLGASKELPRVVACLDDFSHTAALFRAMLAQNVSKLTKTVMASAQYALQTFLIADYTFDEAKFEANEVNDPFVVEMLTAMEPPLSSLLKSLRKVNGDMLIEALAQELSKSIEGIAMQKTFSQYGGLQFNKDVQGVADWCTRKSSKPLHGKYARLKQIAHLLTLDRQLRW
eukprot:m51a1_g7736 Conserved oligomeric Golgi complex subunit 4B (810) ;mRNA; r:175902-179266